MLKPAHEEFSQGIASGLSQSASYRKAFPKSINLKNQAVWDRASKLALKVEVSTRVLEIRREMELKHLWTREESVRVLREVADSEKGSERVAAVKELNAMHGFNEPKKVEHYGGLSGIRLVIEGVEPSAAG